MTGVLNEGYAADLASLTTDEVRTRRDKARQSETDLSYMRRLVQGQLDIVRAEIAHRGGDSPAPVSGHLGEILADESRPEPRGLGSLLVTDPTFSDDQQRYLADLTGGLDLSDVSLLGLSELREALVRLSVGEIEISRTRQQVQDVLDACAAELIRRYRSGEAVVDDLLAGPQA